MADAWAAKQRQAWISDIVSVFGFINRVHIMREFGVSTAQASLDLRVFQRAFPGVIEYDKTAKCYRAVRWKEEAPTR